MERPTVFLSRLGLFALLPIGLLVLALAAWSFWSTKTWLTRTVEVSGTVIEMVRVRDSDNTGYLYYPRVRYTTTDGRTIEFDSSLRTNPPAYRTGQSVQVLYDPGVPDYAVIRGFFSLWLMTVILTFIGSVFLIVGTAMVVMSRYADRMFTRPATT
jgi:hypothetical protein